MLKLIKALFASFQVNNAGTISIKPAVDLTAEDYSLTMSTNFESAFHLSQLAHPLLKASGSSSIVFISSIAGLVGGTQLSLYSATKGTYLNIEIWKFTFL